MTERKSPPEEVEAEVIEDGVMVPVGSFEVDMSGIQRDIEDLTASIDGALAAYGDMLADVSALDGMGYADVKRCEQSLSAAVRDAEERRRKLNRDYKAPLDAAKARYDELMGPVMELHAAYRERRAALDEERRDGKRQQIRDCYETLAPQLALPLDGQDRALVPFERIFEKHGGKWLNKKPTVKEIEVQLCEIVEGIAADEKSLDAAKLAHLPEAKAVYWQTLDVGAAMSRDRELTEAEGRQAALEAERAELERQRAEACAEEAHAAEPEPEPQEAPPAPMAPPAQAPAAPMRAPEPATPRVMLIEGATTAQCCEIGRFCGSIGVTGVFKGEATYRAVVSMTGGANG